MRQQMREHDLTADETTLNALRQLRQPWRGWEQEQGVVRVQTTDGVVVRISVAHANPEKGFAVRRLAAEFERGAVRPVRPVAGLDAGGNDVVILEGESWLTRLAPPTFVAGDDRDDPTRETPAGEPVVTHGHPRARPANVDACCTTTDAVMVATPRGVRWLARLGARADEVEVVVDAGAVGDFLTARGWHA